jgi:hypothetical protein
MIQLRRSKSQSLLSVARRPVETLLVYDGAAREGFKGGNTVIQFGWDTGEDSHSSMAFIRASR